MKLNQPNNQENINKKYLPLKDILDDSIKVISIADCPVTFLSAGLDSTLLVDKS